ncbi:23S rRNA pseudouridine(1911/1915/1917) synthase RluD [Candidatus Halobeggiatoa sp. HSG11]|nr:23S rRNA pseudouridine(1911/1915/1917) synthase RluD [Candidatus Halobeggiatoa sp. HSG11]
MTTKQFTIEIPSDMVGYRLDKALAELFPSYSRARLQQWIKKGLVQVDDINLRGKDKLKGGEHIQLTAQLTEEITWQPQSMELNLVYEDEDILVVNKPAGLVVHPGTGNQDKTLVNALLHYAPELNQLPRAGIIHRLDKDTSGILVVARSVTAHTNLVTQLQNREFIRKYQAVVNGVMVAGSTIDAPIGRHHKHRTRMAVTDSGKIAITHYRVIQRYRNHTAIRVQLETGRTHQIRVHMAYKNYPLLGDSVYSGRLRIPAKSSEEFKNVLRKFSRQALHAEQLGFIHPCSGESMQWTVPLPDDMQNLLQALEKDNHSK